MDAVVGNKYLDLLNNLDIEVSKKLEGEYEVDEIINAFKNFFFNRMFLDITAIKNYKDVSNLQKLSMSLDMNKVIFLLDKDDSISESNGFLSKLVNMGIYNFTSDGNALMYLYNNPNVYRDVSHYQDVNNNVIENALSNEPKNKIILGIKNVTDGAGATTLSYLIKKVLDNYYSTLLIEINKMDLTFFKESNTLSIKENQLGTIIEKYDGVDIFVVDLNNSKDDYLCTDILYLIEPSTIKLNKISTINPNIFNELKEKKVILNKIKLSDKDVADFEVESNLKVFYNIAFINDKEDNSDILAPLLYKLGYIKDISNKEIEEEKEDEKPRKSIFDLFRK